MGVVLCKSGRGLPKFRAQLQLEPPPLQKSCVRPWYSLVPRPFRGTGGEGPGVYRLRMRQNIRYITRKITVYNTRTRV